LPKRPIKVLHLIKALGRGGAEVLLVQGLAVADRERFAYTYGYLQPKPDDTLGDLLAQGASVHCFHLRSNARILLAARRIARFLQQNGIDLVHAHLPMAGIVARLAGRMAGVPVVYTEHCPPNRYNPLVRMFHRFTWPLVTHGIAVSRDVAESMAHELGDRVPVRTVWNGVNVVDFDPQCFDGDEIRGRLGIPTEAHVVGTVAVFRDTPEKRLDLWLNAAGMIRDQVPDTHFIMVGDGPLKEKLVAQANALGLAGAVHFVGRQLDVRPYLAAMDIFLMSSAYEGFGIALVEAMAMEVAVVATNVEGVRNIIEHGETGLLAPFDDDVARGLAGLVVDLLRNPGRRQDLAVAGRQSATENFSIVRMQRELEQTYVSVFETVSAR